MAEDEIARLEKEKAELAKEINFYKEERVKALASKDKKAFKEADALIKDTGSKYGDINKRIKELNRQSETSIRLQESELAVAEEADKTQIEEVADSRRIAAASESSAKSAEALAEASSRGIKVSEDALALLRDENRTIENKDDWEDPIARKTAHEQLLAALTAVQAKKEEKRLTVEEEAARIRALKKAEYAAQEEYEAQQAEKAAAQKKLAAEQAEKKRLDDRSSSQKYLDARNALPKQMKDALLRSKLFDNRVMGFLRGQKGLGDKVGLGWTISKDVAKAGGILIITAVALFFLSLGAMMLYGAQAENCKEVAIAGLQGPAVLKNYIPGTGFTSCVADNIFSKVGFGASKMNIDDAITNFFNKAAYRATGDYYYPVVDENAVEVGIFLENVNTGSSKFDNDKEISMSADIVAKTVGFPIEGIVTCKLDKRLSSSMTPSTGRFFAEKGANTPITCKFNPGFITKSDSYVFELSTEFEFTTFAYSVPSVMKRSLWANRELSEDQKAVYNSKANQLLKNTNKAPVEIGGRIGSGTSIFLVDDTDTDYNEEIPFGITLDGTKGTRHYGWENGQVKEVKALAISMPEWLSFEDENTVPVDTIKTCSGYTFKLTTSCDEVKAYINSTQNQSDYICYGGMHVYLLQSGEGKNLRGDIFDDKFETLQCTLTATTENLFKGDNTAQQLGFNQFPVKIVARYEYKVNERRQIDVTKVSKNPNEGLTTYTCTGDIEAEAAKGTALSTEITDIYSKTFQNLFRSYLSKATSTMERARLEALQLAIAYKFSGLKSTSTNNKDNDNRIDYINGCTKINGRETPTDDYEAELDCSQRDIYKYLELNGNDVSKALESYYADTAHLGVYITASNALTSSTPAETSTTNAATVEDYYNSLRTLCKATSTASATSTSSAAASASSSATQTGSATASATSSTAPEASATPASSATSSAT